VKAMHLGLMIQIDVAGYTPPGAVNSWLRSFVHRA
jgi:hypothetical protein